MPNYRRLHTKGGAFFFTVATYNRQTVFNNIENIRTFRHLIDEVRDEFPFKEIACVLLPDHIHSIWELPDNDYDFSKRWGIIKARFTKYMRRNTANDHNQKIWQPRFWEHEIRNDIDLKNHLDYLHYNPVKHGYVIKTCDWKYSSFHRFVDAGYYDINWGSDVATKDTSEYGE